MKKKFITLSASVMIGMGSLLTVPAVSAENINSQRQEIQKSIDEAKTELTDLQAQRSKIEEKISSIEKAIEENNLKITEADEQIHSTKAEVERLNAEIALIEERINARNNILKDRAVSFQENGGQVRYLDVILGSSSFSDFIDRIDAVATIVEADQSLIEAHNADKTELEEKQKNVNSKLADLNSLKVELEGMQMHINDQKAQSEALKQELIQKENANEQELADLKQRDAELAAQAQAALEAAAKEAAAKSVQSNQTSQKASVREETNTKTSNTVSNSVSKTESNIESNTVSNPSGGLATVIKAGYKYIGNSTYKFGGGRTASDIARGYFDCSAFVSWAFKQGGYNIGASTSVLRNQGTKISLSEAKPGDLVFFDTYKKDGHVGIYLGGGKFIGSQSSTGIAIANMNSGYYQKTFSGHVRRVAN
ncbi:MAG: NlpC/P60 family protein [Bacillus sp. (in: firmicutes)]